MATTEPRAGPRARPTPAAASAAAPAPTAAQPVRRARLAGPLQAAMVLVPAEVLAWFGWQRRWVAEDAFIDLRVVAHLLAGHGPVFNLQERVEVYTNPLWVALLAAGAALLRPLLQERFSLEWLAVALGLACSAGGLLLAGAAALRLAGHERRDWRESPNRRVGPSQGGRPGQPGQPGGREGPGEPGPGSRLSGFALPLGGLVVAAIPAYWDFATSGLETGLAFAWLGLCAWGLAGALCTLCAVGALGAGRAVGGVPDTAPAAGQRAGRHTWWLPVAIGLGPLIRPDLAILSAGFLLLLLALSWPGPLDEGRKSKDESDTRARHIRPLAPLGAGSSCLRRAPFGCALRQARGGPQGRQGRLFVPSPRSGQALRRPFGPRPAASARVRRAAAIVVAAAALPAAYQLFRMGYFAAVVPNTAIAKEAGAARWDQGWRYLADFAGVYWLWIPLAALLGWWVCRLAHLVALARCPEQPGAAKVSSAAWRRFLGSRRSGAQAHRTGEGLPPTRTRAHAAFLIVPVVCGLAHAAYVVRLGGDFMHGRMLLPSLFALTLPAALVVGTRWWHVALPALVVVPWAVASMLWFRPPYRGLAPGGVAGIGPQGIADERAFYVTFSRQTHPVTLADYGAAWWAQHGHALRTLAESAEHERRRVVLPVRDALPAVSPGQPDQPGTPGRPAAAELPLAPSAKADLVVHRNNVGLTAYAAGPRVHVVDHLGLGDPLAARLRLERRARPGHEKGLPNEWVAAPFGAPHAPLPPVPAPAPPPPAVPAAAPRASLDPAAAAAARAALACGDLAELLRSIEAPLTPERFLRNVALAWRLTRLRIPADPHQARAELCRAQP